jgi:hypothetical protein
MGAVYDKENIYQLPNRPFELNKGAGNNQANDEEDVEEDVSIYINEVW